MEIDVSRRPWLRCLASAAAALIAFSSPAVCIAAEDQAERQGVSDSEVVIGSCSPITGTLAERGKQLQLGAKLYLDSVNESGGVNGRKVKLEFCDDKYNPDVAITCFTNCLKDKVFAGAYFVGSAPISKYVRMGETTRMPLFGFCTGTPLVYEFHPTQFVLRAGYSDEVEKQIDVLWTKCGIRKIAVIYQSDAFGAAIRGNVISCLQRYKAAPIVEASYTRGSSDVSETCKQVLAANPEAIIVGATSDALINVIKKRNAEKWKALCMTFSVGTDYLGEMGNQADGVILTQVIPLTDSKLPSAELYNKLRKKYMPQTEANLTAFEAFVNTIVLVAALKKAGRDLTREKFIKAMESLHDFDIGLGADRKLNYSSANHNGLTSKSVYFTIIKDGKLAPISDGDLKRLSSAAKK